MNTLVPLYFCKIYTITKDFIYMTWIYTRRNVMSIGQRGGGEFDPKLKKGVSLQSIRFFAHSWKY